MISVISPDLLKDEVFTSCCPVLLAVLRKNDDYPLQIRELEALLDQFNGRIKVCLADAYYLRAFFKRFRFGGTPCFLLMVKGRERARFFGRADAGELAGFIEENLEHTAARI